MCLRCALKVPQKSQGFSKAPLRYLQALTQGVEYRICSSPRKVLFKSRALLKLVRGKHQVGKPGAQKREEWLLGPWGRCSPLFWAPGFPPGPSLGSLEIPQTCLRRALLKASLSRPQRRLHALIQAFEGIFPQELRGASRTPGILSRASQDSVKTLNSLSRLQDKDG